jgi:hypothetical protein
MGADSRVHLRVEQLHQAFLDAVGDAVLWHSTLETKPLSVDLRTPLPPKLRAYMYNATFPPGGRAMGEHKIQLIVPNQARGDRGNFDSSGGRIPLLLGYRSDLQIFICWDAELYSDFAYSRNVQVKPETVYEAFGQGIARQKRTSWNRPPEIVIAADARHLGQAILERQQETLKRVLGSNV